MHLARDVKKKQGDRLERVYAHSLINEKGKLAAADMEKAEILNKFFASVFTASQVSRVSHITEPLGGG